MLVTEPTLKRYLKFTICSILAIFINNVFCFFAAIILNIVISVNFNDFIQDSESMSKFFSKF